jgi:hypothetical protein
MIGTKITIDNSDPLKNIGEVTVIDSQKLMDNIVLAVDGTEHISVENILKMGWQEVKDRGMSENNGHLFYGPKNWVLRFWTVAPRIELSFKNSVAFDSAKADPESFGPGKPLPMGILKDKMTTYAIL